MHSSILFTMFTPKSCKEVFVASVSQPRRMDPQSAQLRARVISAVRSLFETKNTLPKKLVTKLPVHSNQQSPHFTLLLSPDSHLWEPPDFTTCNCPTKKQESDFCNCLTLTQKPNHLRQSPNSWFEPYYMWALDLQFLGNKTLMLVFREKNLMLVIFHIFETRDLGCRREEAIDNCTSNGPSSVRFLGLETKPNQTIYLY